MPLSGEEECDTVTPLMAMNLDCMYQEPKNVQPLTQ